MAPEGWTKIKDFEYRHHQGKTASVGSTKRMGGPPRSTKLPSLIAYKHDPDEYGGGTDTVNSMDKHEQSPHGYIAKYSPGHRNTQPNHMIPVIRAQTKKELREAMQEFMEAWPDRESFKDYFLDYMYYEDMEYGFTSLMYRAFQSIGPTDDRPFYIRPTSASAYTRAIERRLSHH